MLNLFKNIVPVEKQHLNYRLLSTSRFHENERHLIEQWSDGFKDRDKKIVKEFQTSFNSTFWELYLYQCFKRLGFNIDFSYSSPDFVINSDICDFSAEATIANNPNGFLEEFQGDFEHIPKTAHDYEKILYLACIRIANSFTSKYSKYENYYRTLSHVSDKAFVICIAPFEQPFSFIQNDIAVRRVLYAYNEPLYIDDADTGERYFIGTSEIPTIYKENGSKIELGLFADDRFPDVSAVIFSSTATMTKLRALSKNDEGQYIIFQALRYNSEKKHPIPIVGTKDRYLETLLDGLHVYINPFAKKRLNVEHFSGREIAIHYYLPKEKYCLTDVPHGFLISHGCITCATGQKEIAKIRSLSLKSKTKAFDFPEWPKGELIYVGGNSGLFTENYMAHWNNYTIIVAKDTIDNDWCAQALPGIYFNTSWYFKSNRETESKGLITLSESFDSKEEAFEKIKSKIDKIVEAGK